MEGKLEIEKRYLLKGLPIVNYDETLHITQYYGSIGRLRHTNGHVFKTNEKYTKYHLTIKKEVKPGVNQEFEIEISEAEFIHHKQLAEKYIHKTRYVKHINGLKWEIDVFSFKLIIAEVEVPTEEELLTVAVPNFIDKLLIMDVTGFNEFSNYKLADTIKTQEQPVN